MKITANDEIKCCLATDYSDVDNYDDIIEKVEFVLFCYSSLLRTCLIYPKFSEKTLSILKAISYRMYSNAINMNFIVVCRSLVVSYKMLYLTLQKYYDADTAYSIIYDCLQKLIRKYFEKFDIDYKFRLAWRDYTMNEFLGFHGENHFDYFVYLGDREAYNHTVTIDNIQFDKIACMFEDLVRPEEIAKACAQFVPIDIKST
jgi:hypothetical protein